MQVQHSLENIKSSWLSFRGCKAFRKQKPPKFTKAKSVGYRAFHRWECNLFPKSGSQKFTIAN